MPQQQGQQQQQGQEQDGAGSGDTSHEGQQPAAPGDVYTAMARDLAEYEQEVAARQQQQQQRGGNATSQAGDSRGMVSFAAAILSDIEDGTALTRDNSWGEEVWAGRRGRGRGRGRGRWHAPGSRSAGESAGRGRGQMQQMPMPPQARPQEQQ
jgi:hypothetical protein